MPKSVDILMTNAIVLTMDEDFNQYEPGAVAIKGDSIVSAGPQDTLEKEYKAKEKI